MPCIPIKSPDGRIVGMACTRGHRGSPCSTPGCTKYSSKLCDYPVVRDGQPGTCDARLCARCAVKVGPNKDYCPPHARIAKENKTP